VAKVTMPQLGESVAEGTIGRWLKKPGDHVEKYESIVEVVTDKVNAEVPSPFAGTLTAILVEEGTTVPNETPIAEIETADAAEGDTLPAASPAAPGAPGPAAAPPAAQVPKPAAIAATTGAPGTPVSAAPGTVLPHVADPAARATPAVRRLLREHGLAPAQVEGTGGRGRITRADVHLAAGAGARWLSAAAPAIADADARITPAVRRLLREHGLAPEQVVGTGAGGRITREDVTAAVEAIRTGVAPAAAAAGPGAPRAPAAAPGAPAPAAAATVAGIAGVPLVFPPGADEVVVPLTQMRKGIAAQMTRALQVPHAYVHVEVDVSSLVRLRDALKRDYQAREGISLSFVPFIVRASVEALRRNPTFNATWTEQGLVAKRRVNVGVAVAVDDGLIVPVVRDVDQMSIHAINRAIADVAGRARAKKLRVDDFGGGTFTVDNTGWFGSNLTMPIINVPEVAILTMEAITKRAVVVETPQGDVIAIRPVMNVVIGIDHRANDGAQAGYFLRDVKGWLEGVGPDTVIY
jgi:2-oxoisovalerate dehydrogenase E2 component (dihydrolipoyl transacylase)